MRRISCISLALTLSSAGLLMDFALSSRPSAFGSSNERLDDQITATEKEADAWQKQRTKKWNQVLSPLHVDDMLFYWINYLDPAPDSAFKPFGDERLAPWVTESSSEYFGLIFQEAANPYANKQKPSRYYLSRDKDNHSLLYYEWKNGHYSFKAQESSYAILLFVQSSEVPFLKKSGIGSADVGKVLNELFSPVIACGDAEKAFKLDGTLFPGSKFTNADYFGGPHIPGFKKRVFGFLSHRGLCLLGFKKHEGRQHANFAVSDKDWLPRALFTKDGKLLMTNE